MWNFLQRINLIRYLVVWRVNSALARIPRCFSKDISLLLANIVAERLPSGEATSWRKMLNIWDKYEKSRGRKDVPPVKMPERLWPVESVIFVYPGKTAYGREELIFWELKLMGRDANHDIFLEVILPAMEEASRTTDPKWYRPNRIWGRFDIHSIFVARGNHWDPLVREGRLNLRYRVTPLQWLEGTDFNISPRYIPGDQILLSWLTPFDLKGNYVPLREGEAPPLEAIPTMRDIINSLLLRLEMIILNRKVPTGELQKALDKEDIGAVEKILNHPDCPPIFHDLKSVPEEWPGYWSGYQIFSAMPAEFAPYLELASILHVGKYTHFGCGTFSITVKS